MSWQAAIVAIVVHTRAIGGRSGQSGADSELPRCSMRRCWHSLRRPLTSCFGDIARPQLVGVSCHALRARSAVSARSNGTGGSGRLAHASIRSVCWQQTTVLLALQTFRASRAERKLPVRPTGLRCCSILIWNIAGAMRTPGDRQPEASTSTERAVESQRA
jgi:hypothetical protein